MAQFRHKFPVRLLHVIALLGLLPAIESLADSKNGFALDGALIPSEQILHGGPGRDGIPSLDDPTFVAAGKAKFLAPNDRVLGIEINGIRRAYPIRILNYHEL